MSDENESAPDGADLPQDPIDAEFQELVEETGPISKEAELLND